MAIVADDDEAMTSIANDDRSEIQQYHWQTDVFNNMDIDEVKKMISSTTSVHTKKNICIAYKCNQIGSAVCIYLI